MFKYFEVKKTKIKNNNKRSAAQTNKKITSFESKQNMSHGVGIGEGEGGDLLDYCLFVFNRNI